jgi:amidase
MHDDIPYLGLLAVADRIRRGALTSTQVVAALLARIERLEPRLNSFLAVMREAALQQAAQADREVAAGQWRGPLHGVPIGIKDLIDVAGVPATSGMTIFKDKVPPHDATVVKRLKQAGAVIIGKLHMTEAATLDHHPSLPRPANPWGVDYWTGVSSSGSGVATAAGLCFGALGSDTAGSIRMPSAACGLSGIKPTWGRVSRHGVFPLAESFDHIGPMARSVADAAAMLQVIAGDDPDDPSSLCAPVPDYAAALGGGVRGLVIGVDRRLLERVEEEVVANVRAALEIWISLGARIREVTLQPVAELTGMAMPMLSAETMAAHQATFPAQADGYGPKVRRSLEMSAYLTPVMLARAVHARAALRGEMGRLFQGIDLLLTPAAPRPTPTWDELEALGDDMAAVVDRVARYTAPFNASGNPTLSLPSGFSRSGLPLGVQLVGPDLGEALLCRAGHAFQQVTGFHTRHPELG